MAELDVSVVATNRDVWSGAATLVVFDTLDGQIGIMAKHSPMMAVLKDAPVLIRTVDSGDVYAAVHGGFVTVDGDNVIILAELAEMSDDIDADEATRTVAELDTVAEDDPASKRMLERAQVRLATVEKAQNAKSR